MKRLFPLALALTIALTLTACGDCLPDPVIGSADTAITAPVTTPTPYPVQTPEPTPVAVPMPILAPTPAPAPAPVVISGITFCPESSTVICPVSPYPVPLVPIVVIDPDPAPVCVRNSEPLVYIEPFWVDNCGAKYGATLL